MFIMYLFVDNVQGYLSKQDNSGLKQFHIIRDQGCSQKNMCKSQWGFCGIGPEYCGTGCQSGPCIGTGNNYNNNKTNIINQTNFQCAFYNLSSVTRAQRFDGLNRSGWKPFNNDEAAVFLAHVYHETDGLKTLIEYCAPSKFHSI